MELDDFKTSWIQNDRRLDDALRLHAPLRAMSAAETALQRHRRFLILELMANALVLLAVGSFAGDHAAQPRFFIPGLVLHLAAIALSGACVRQLFLLRGIDYAQPLVLLQTKVEQLRIERSRVTKWTLITAPLLWVPLLVVSLKAGLGVDAWSVLDTPWLVANLLFGVLFIPVMLLAAHHAAPRSPRLRRLADDLSDRSLNTAKRALEDVSRFAAHEP